MASAKDDGPPEVVSLCLVSVDLAMAWQISGEYVDHISGAKDKRPALDRLMADAHQRRLDAVVVWRFDPFARSVSHLLRALETFRALGVEFVSLSEQVDTSTPMGKMVFTGVTSGGFDIARYCGALPCVEDNGNPGLELATAALSESSGFRDCPPPPSR